MMLLCPICAGEFEVVQVSLCPGCGVRLIPESLEPATERTPPSSDDSDVIEFEELCRPLGYSIAMLIQQMLEQNGIAAIVQGGHSMSILPSLSFLGQMRVLVDRRQLEYARQLYEAYFESGDADAYDYDGESDNGGK
jgi:hypothetical protein